jgi:hypothetical protein
MRVSADPNDPDYRPGLINARVYLDGSLLKNVVCADEEAGVVRVLAVDAAGHVLVEGDEFKIEMLRGIVKILVDETAAA